MRAPVGEGDLCPRPDPACDSETAADQIAALAHPEQLVALIRRAAIGIKPAPIVADDQPQLPAVALQDDLDLLGFGVLGDVIERRLVMLEGIFIAVMSCLVAAVPAPLLTALIMDYLPTPGIFRLSLSGVAVWVVAAVAGAAVATLAPASRAARLTVREAPAYL